MTGPTTGATLANRISRAHGEAVRRGSDEAQALAAGAMLLLADGYAGSARRACEHAETLMPPPDVSDGDGGEAGWIPVAAAAFQVAAGVALAWLAVVGAVLLLGGAP